MKHRLLAALALVAFVAAPAFALADASTSAVSIPVNEWVGSLAAIIGPVLAAAVVWLIRKLPAQMASLLMTMRVDQLLTRAIDFAVNSVKDATKDKALTVDVGNEVVAKALQYAIDHGPKGISDWMGGPDMIRQKIIARLNLDAKAALK